MFNKTTFWRKKNIFIASTYTKFPSYIFIVGTWIVKQTENACMNFQQFNEAFVKQPHFDYIYCEYCCMLNPPHCYAIAKEVAISSASHVPCAFKTS